MSLNKAERQKLVFAYFDKGLTYQEVKRKTDYSQTTLYTDFRDWCVLHNKDHKAYANQTKERIAKLKKEHAIVLAKQIERALKGETKETDTQAVAFTLENSLDTYSSNESSKRTSIMARPKILDNKNLKRGDIIVNYDTSFSKLILQTTYTNTHITSMQRPCVIIQNNTGNSHSENLIVAMISSSIKRSDLPTHLVIDYPFLDKKSMITTEQIQTIPKFNVHKIGSLNNNDLICLNQALRINVYNTSTEFVKEVIKEVEVTRGASPSLTNFKHLIPTLHGAFVQYKFINQDEIELRYEDFNLILDKLQVQDIISTKIIRENQSIVLEDLSVKNMMQSKKLAKGISEVSWYQFRLMIEYKAKWYGREVIIADKHFASSLYQ